MLRTAMTASYRFDGLRAKKSTSSGTQYFLYDDSEPVIEMDASGTVTRMNIFAPDGLFASGTTAAWTYYTFDPQGSVAQRLNSSQAITSSSYYDAYGQEYTTGAPSDPFGYNANSGYYLDRQTGKYLLGHRYYDWSAGRFLTRDPIGYAGGINLYGYCADEPLLMVDPDGTCGVCDFFAGWGDTLSFGGTKIARRYLGLALGIGDANESVDYGTGWYAGGEAAGTLNDIAFGAAGGWELGAKAAGKEFSHFIPARTIRNLAERLPGFARSLKAFDRCPLNGNYVSPAFHAMTDPFRVARGSTFGYGKALPPLLSLPLRASFPVTGGLIGLGSGIGHSLWGRE